MRTLALILLCLLCMRARAQEAHEPIALSARGRQLVAGALGGSWSNEREPLSIHLTPSFSIFAQPSWLIFVRDGIGIGAYCGYQLSRRSSGLDNPTDRQSKQNLNSPLTDSPAFRTPLAHDLSFGATSALELYRGGRFSIFARPYVGMSLHAYERYTVASGGSFGPGSPVAGAPVLIIPDGTNRVRAQREFDVRFEAGLRVPLVYQASSALGFGFGPDLLWENLAGDFNAVRIGMSSWLVFAL